MKTLNILYQSSSLYALPAAVSICSLLENNRELDIKIWYIDVQLENIDRISLTALVEHYGQKIDFISSQEVDTLLKKAKISNWNGSYAAFYKIFITQYLDDIESILYIDSDTLILGSLKDLIDFNFEDASVAMVPSAITNSIKKYLDINLYFNAGVILFNLSYWRENCVLDEFIKIINGSEALKYTLIADETFINLVLKNKIKRLPLEYNFESSWWLWGWNKKLYKYLFPNNKPYFNEKEIYEAKNNAIIAHYINLTTGRPWDFLNDNIWKKEFRNYYCRVDPWRKINIKQNEIGKNNLFLFILKKFIIKSIPFSIRSILGFKQHDKAIISKIEEIDNRRF